MELWIRSQDKLTMMEVNDIKIIDYRGLKVQLEKSIFSFVADMDQMESYLDKDGWGLSCNETCLGIYETKERALEVLDEIQKTIINNEVIRIIMPNVKDMRGNEELYKENVFNTMVYEMPKE